MTESTQSHWTNRALPVAGLAALGIFSVATNRWYQFADWLFFRYALCLLYSLILSLACISSGYALIQRIVPDAPVSHRLVFSSAAGVFILSMGLFIGGLMGILSSAYAVLLTVFLCLIGARDLLRLWRDGKWSAKWRDFTFEYSPLQLCLFVFGTLAIGVLYLMILSPRNASFDSRMYHLGLAEGWAAVGAVRPSVEGWFVETLPQLSALFYVWAYLVPGTNYFVQVVLAAHMEFVVFIWTLAAIPVGVRCLVPNAQASLSWTAMLTFPAIYLYDAGLFIGSDHIAALYGIPILLALYHAWDLTPRACGLLAGFMGCAILVKYQAFSICLGPLLVVFGRMLYLAWRQFSKTDSHAERLQFIWLKGPLVALAVGLAVTAPHWFKNWLWYGDPLYPLLHKHLSLEPWHSEATANMKVTWQRLTHRPDGDLGQQLTETVSQFWRIGFADFARGRFHGKWPMFGTLFSLVILWLPFVRRAKRIWGLLLMSHLGVFVWYFMTHVERYLQVLIPWMAVVVAAAVVLAWRQGHLSRIAISSLLLFQVVWGADSIFYPTHAMNRGQSALEVSAKLITSGFRGKLEARENFFGAFTILGKAIPEGAVVLLHEHNPRTGFHAEIVSDMPGNQGRINYGSHASARSVYDLYKDMGITHLVWRRGVARGADSLAGDLVFHDLIRSVKQVKRSGSWVLGKLPDKPPPERVIESVAYAGCKRRIQKGVYPRNQFNFFGKRRLTTKRRLPKKRARWKSVIGDADYIVFDPTCHKGKRPNIFKGYKKLATRKKAQLWRRVTTTKATQANSLKQREGGVPKSAVNVAPRPDSQIPEKAP